MKALAFLLAIATAASAQNVVLKDGKVITAKALRRQGETIVATVELPGAEAGRPANTGEFGYPLAQIAKLDFPEPPALRTAPELITQGKAAEALAQLDPVVNFYSGFRDAPGSWWAESVLLKAQTLVALGREKEAEPLAELVARGASDPQIVLAAQVQAAATHIRKGADARTLEIAERALKESTRPGTRAPATVLKGWCLLEKKDWEEALLAFLEVPVFHPGEKILQPQALLGAGRAQFGMEDLARAKATLNELLKTYAAAPEAADAQAELAKIERREKALAQPK